MTAVGKRTAVIPMICEKGMWKAGDPSTMPDGYCISLRNYLIRPLRQDGRPPFVYDGLMNVANFLRWEDNVNEVTRTLAIDTSQNLRTRNDAAANYTATVITGTPTGRLTDFANFRGKVYQMYDNGSGVPASASVYDGTAVSTSPFNTAIVSRTVTAFIERLFLAYPRITFTIAPGTGGYDWSNNTNFSRNGCTATSITASGYTVCRVYPTSTTAANVTFASIGMVTAANADPRAFVWRQDLRNTSSSYSVPFTMQMELNTGWGSGIAFNVGDIVTGDLFGAAAHLAFVCRIAGTSGGAAPAWATTVGADTVDNTITWRCIGSAIFGTLEDYLPPDTQNWYPFYCVGKVPAATNQQSWTIYFRFGNTTTPTITLTAIDVSLKDGLTDGNPAKANKGMQITTGDFYYPFFNQESSGTTTLNMDAIVWSEIDEPKRILAKNTYTLPEVAGLATAACVVAGRYVVFKRRGFWVFKRTTDKNIPIIPERPANQEVGCIGPRAWDIYGGGEQGDMVYWIGDDGIYRMGESWAPEEIGGPGMREEIMDREGGTWVENQSTYNVPFLVVEHANKEVWVYTQKGKIYVFHIPTGAWSYIDVSGSKEVQSMLWDYRQKRMLVSWGALGATRLALSSTASDTLDATATPLAITFDVIYKPLELFGPRYQSALHGEGVFHLATASQSGQTITPSYSLDRGATFTTPSGYPATVSLSSNRVPLPMRIVAPSVTVKISRSGGGGKANWSISKADATVQVKRGELPWANAVSV